MLAALFVQMISYVLFYLIWLPVYPATLMMYLLQSSALGSFAIWLVLGIAAGLYFHHKRLKFLLSLWLAIWFMPGPLICGAAALIPWITTPPYYFVDGNCVSLVSMGVSFAMNLGIALAGVFFSDWVLVKFFADKFHPKLVIKSIPVYFLILFLLPYLLALTGYVNVNDILMPEGVGLLSLAMVSGIAGILYHFALAIFCFQTNRNAILWVGVSAFLLQIALSPVIIFFF
jgi:hypothetical protein